jgi:predicted ArsR family transcriptional regulator
MKIDNTTLLTLCLSGKTQAQIAKELHMTKAQVCRRVNDADFQQLLSEYRKAVLDSVLTELTASAHKSVETLVALLDDENSFARLQAACKILSLAQEYGIQKDLMQDIAEWKQSQADTQL